jgi:hypothetical protein
MSKLIIQVGGGLVQDVFRSGKGKMTKVFIVDFDDEEFVLEEITQTKDLSGAYLGAYIIEQDINKLPINSDVDLIIKAYEKSHQYTKGANNVV